MVIYYTDIVNSLKQLLKSNFPNNNIYSDEIKEGMIRPAFHINLLPETVSNFNDFYRQQNVLIDISYFSEEEPQLQSKENNLNMLNKLQNIFNTELKVKEYYVHIDNFEPDIVDRILHTTFNLMWYNDNEVTEKYLEQFEDMHTVIFPDGYSITDLEKLKEKKEIYVNTNKKEQIYVKEE